jgi:hypothetical protein
MPWYLRTSVEGLGIAFTVLFVVAMVPRLRTLYERSVERRLEGFDGAINLSELSAEERAAKEATQSLPLNRGVTSTERAETEDDFSGSESGDNGDDEESVDVDTAGTHVGNSEIWRFILKTDSPPELRAKVVQALTELNVSPQTPGFAGIEAPGGIQFDLLLPQSVVLSLKQRLQRIAPPTAPRLANATTVGDSFTWYKNKNKSRTKIPAGKARVVIWLSQM